MFSLDDKVNLAICNSMDLDGNILAFNLKLPIKKDFKIPSNLVQTSVFEYNPGIHDEGKVSFNIYIGECKTLRDFFGFDRNEVERDFEIKDRIGKIKSIDDRICYYTLKNGLKVVYTLVNDNDIVVKNKEELKEVIISISDEFNNIRNNTYKLNKHK